MRLLFSIVLVFTCQFCQSQNNVDDIIKKIKTKYSKVLDYEATGKLKTNVLFFKVPVANIKVYFKNPSKLKIKNESGVSFIPKGSVNVNLGNVFSMLDFQALDAGEDMINGTKVKVIKILPNDNESADIVLSTLYIDVKNLLVLKSKTTTKENGTYDLTMQYGQYAAYGLPSKAIFSFNTKAYKLPKGITFDYDNGAAKDALAKSQEKIGKIEITYTSYSINKGLKDDVFK